MSLVHETVEANGICLHVARAGDGPLMLFLHGFPEYWAMWRPMLEHFGARGWCAAAPDLRGYNVSEKPAAVEAYRAKHLVADVFALAARYTKEKFVLVAHDWGGAVAWGVAIARPERLSKLVMLNSPHPYIFWRELCNNPAQQKASEYMLLFRHPKAERVLSENGHARLLAWFTDLNDAARGALIEAWSQPGALTGGLNYYRASPMYPSSAEDPGARKLHLKPEDFIVRVPTLVVWGERDMALLPGCLDGLDEVVPDLKLVRVPEASHWIARERTDLVIREIEAFTIAR
ncbi:MAG: alpha/beta hydrolase, partial [Betaproteobacteria bacterium]|nr:alpha/beta hydrolase [Betaproteobacteria bacterium]MDH5536518.1 alpha/beta hydrolase [Betaproteobacteria bacterium]